MYMLLGTENEKHAVRPYMPCLLHDSVLYHMLYPHSFSTADISLSSMCRLSLWSTQLPIQSVPGMYLRVQWLKHDTHNSLLSSIESKNVQSDVATSQFLHYVMHAEKNFPL
jgi:hypothetical protein